MNAALGELPLSKIWDCVSALIGLLPKLYQLRRVAHDEEGALFADCANEVFINLLDGFHVFLGTGPLVVLCFDR